MKYIVKWCGHRCAVAPFPSREEANAWIIAKTAEARNCLGEVYGNYSVEEEPACPS